MQQKILVELTADDVLKALRGYLPPQTSRQIFQAGTDGTTAGLILGEPISESTIISACIQYTRDQLKLPAATSHCKLARILGNANVVQITAEVTLEKLKC